MRRMQTLRGARLQIVLTAVLFSTGGAAIKACQLNGWQVASFRSGIAAVALLLMLPASRRGWTPRTLLIGAVYGLTMLLFVLSTKLTTAANAIFLQSTAPIYTLLLAPWLLRESIRRRDVLFMGVLAVGFALFFVGTEQATASAPDPFTGNLLAVACGVAWAFTITGLRGLGKTGEGNAAGPALVAGNLFACLVALPMALPVERIRPADVAVLLFLGVFQIGLAYVLLTSGLRRVPAVEGSLLLQIEPVLNPIWAWILHGEIPGPWSIAACGLILTATVVKSWADAREG